MIQTNRIKIQKIQAQKKKDQTEILDDTFIKNEGLV